ncbi:MAG: ABC transporter permease, partial [Pseudomonadota bacterium]
MTTLNKEIADQAQAHEEVIGSQDLKRKLSQSLRRSKIRAFLLVLPILAFIGFSFILPIFDMLTRSVANPVVSSVLPNVSAMLENWDQKTLPDEEIFKILYEDMMIAREKREL